MTFELFTNVLIYLKTEVDALLAAKSDTAHSHTHASTTGQTADDHHAQAHTLASHSAKAHGDLTDVTADQHHAQSHSHASHTGIGADDHHAEAHTHTVKVPILGQFDNTVAASTTKYVPIQAAGAGASNEANATVVFSVAGTLKNWRVRTTTAQPANNSFVLTVYKDANPDALTITIAAGAAAGFFTDLTHSVAVVAGTIVSLEFKNNANATSAKIAGWGFEFDPS